MKKTFEIEETIKYYHTVEVEVEDEEDFEDFANEIGNSIDCDVYENKEDILHTFIEEYGTDNVSFTEGCPYVEIG